MNLKTIENKLSDEDMIEAEKILNEYYEKFNAFSIEKDINVAPEALLGKPFIVKGVPTSTDEINALFEEWKLNHKIINKNMEFKEFLEKLKASNIDQKSSEFTEDMQDDLYELWESFDPSMVASELDIEKHRWYELSTDVYEVDGKYFGVRGATQMYSESSDWSDLCVTWDLFEMKPVQITTYVNI